MRKRERGRGEQKWGSRDSKKRNFRGGLYSLFLSVSPFLRAGLAARALQICVLCQKL